MERYSKSFFDLTCELLTFVLVVGVVVDWVYDARCLFLTMPRVQLFERIDARCEVIVEAGLIQVTRSGDF